MPTLFFDTETTGFGPRGQLAHKDNIHRYAHLVQLGAVLMSDDRKPITMLDLIIKPEGYEIPSAAANVHKITTERANKEGLPHDVVMSLLYGVWELADTVVAHNLSFDIAVLDAASFRATETNISLKGKASLCTMLSSTEYCAIPGKWGKPKWPKLDELHKFLFNETFSGAHDAMVDVKATIRCYYELIARGVIK